MTNAWRVPLRRFRPWADSALLWASSVMLGAMRRAGFEVVSTTLLGLHLAELLERLEVDVVLDVGARVGDYGFLLRRNGYKGRIVSFEPVLSNLTVLRKRASRDALWDVRPCALGEKEGVAIINVAGATDFSSFRQLAGWVPGFYAPAVFRSTEQVEVHRLEDIWGAAVREGQAVFLKLDTQGWDLEVLRGAGSRAEDLAAIQIEVGFEQVYEGAPLLDASLSALREFDFFPTGLFPVTKRPDGRLIEMDCVAIRCSGAGMGDAAGS